MRERLRVVRGRAVALAMALLLVSAASALAQSSREARACFGTNKADELLTRCQAVIARGDREQPAVRARAHGRLADVFRERGESDRAIQELNAAIALAPGELRYLANRAVSSSDKGERTKAMRDYGAEIGRAHV